MGKADGRPIEFWTKDEYDTFIATVDKKAETISCLKFSSGPE